MYVVVVVEEVRGDDKRVAIDVREGRADEVLEWLKGLRGYKSESGCGFALEGCVSKLVKFPYYTKVDDLYSEVVKALERCGHVTILTHGTNYSKAFSDPEPDILWLVWTKEEVSEIELHQELLERIKPYGKHNIFTAKYEVDENGVVKGISPNAKWTAMAFEGYADGEGRFIRVPKGDIIVLILDDEDNEFLPVISFLTREEARKLANELLRFVDYEEYKWLVRTGVCPKCGDDLIADDGVAICDNCNVKYYLIENDESTDFDVEEVDLNEDSLKDGEI